MSAIVILGGGYDSPSRDAVARSEAAGVLAGGRDRERRAVRTRTCASRGAHAARRCPPGPSRSATSGAGQIRLREWLVVSQVALAFVLLVGAGLLLASFHRLRPVDLGVEPDGVMTFEAHLPAARFDSIARADSTTPSRPGRDSCTGSQRPAGSRSCRPPGPTTGGDHRITGPLANTPKAGSIGGENRMVRGPTSRRLECASWPAAPSMIGTCPGAPDRVIISQSLADSAVSQYRGRRPDTQHRWPQERDHRCGRRRVAVDNEGRSGCVRLPPAYGSSPATATGR